MLSYRIRTFLYYVNVLFLIVLAISHFTKGDLESTFARCCALGANWARGRQNCQNFPAPVPRETTEHQSICITVASICCIRSYRETQCENAKQVAKSGLECTTSVQPGGEFFKDCCDGCKLGLMSGSMGMGCGFKGFSFGFPWNDAYLECCIFISTPGTANEGTLTSETSSNAVHSQSGSVYSDLGTDDKNFLFVNRPDAKDIKIPDSENLCHLFPGQLCGHVCVPTPGSYVCQCRAGFTLSVDGKTCIQDHIKDRCNIDNPCDHICRDTGVSIECLCNPGFQLSSDGRSCNDIDECLQGIHLCTPLEQVCYNQPGYYSCINTDGSLSSPRLPSVRLESPTLRMETQNIGLKNISPGILGNQNIGLTNPTNTLLLTQQANQGRCPLGFIYNLQSHNCDDVDECSIAIGICGPGAVCQNTIGSFSCSPIIIGKCPSGYKFDINHQSCLDTDECASGTHSCDPSEFCINTLGSFECQNQETHSDCPAGYKYNTKNKICEDVDECSEGLHSCHPEEEVCKNVIGKYECDMKCEVGFQSVKDPLSCTDINECKSGIHGCNPLLDVCLNTVGSYSCRSITTNDVRQIQPEPALYLPKVTTLTPLVQECPDGYGFDLITSQCLDINECAAELHNCTASIHHCINTLGSFLCRPKSKCSIGYAINPETQQCVDVDECAEGLATCLPGQICVNTDGSFECQVECRDGFVYNPNDPAICVDINECLTNPCITQQRCSNTEGSYQCLPELMSTTPSTTRPTSLLTTVNTSSIPVKRPKPTKTTTPCPNGYRRKRKNLECKDINECKEGSDHCLRLTEECVNIPGNYTCKPKPCSRGFFRDFNTNECKDLDECTNFPCRFNEECINTPGSFICRVRPPCEEGFRRNDLTKECEDIDECIEDAPCAVSTRCINTRGSYRCRSLECSAGYQHDQAMGKCEDVNECETGEHTCHKPGEECINSPGTYRCKALPSCPGGFKRDPSTFRCVDVDECAEGLAECLEGEKCVNQYGRYKCTPKECSVGYEYHDAFKSCQDIDECEKGTNNCDSIEQSCVNSAGSFRCVDRQPVCDFGFRYDDGLQECRDIDECAEQSHLCSSTRENCVNLPGGYRCDRKDAGSTSRPHVPTTTSTSTTTTFTTTTTGSPKSLVHPALPQCPIGYIYSAVYRSCIDIDECEANMCEDEEMCINTLGGYECDCKDGYAMNAIISKCTDINECQLGLHTCQNLQRCDNTLGSYTCTRISGCGTGYTLNHNTGKCEDINECTESVSPCKNNEICYNLIGSYECRPKINCGRGYRLNLDGTQCIDIDECEENLDSCDGGQLCTNRPGGYICQCPTGYRLDINRQCKDINECQTAYSSLCGNTGDCENTPGSYRCHCKPGFKKSEDGLSCKDIDECTEVENICEHSCINIWGSHYCTCNAGYKLAFDNRTCSDIDECEEIRGRGRLCLGLCVNTPGLFKCNCPNGYKLDTDQRTCKDVNECDNIGTCRDADEICVNIRGGHRCQKIVCPPNYVRDTSHRNVADTGLYCRKACESQDRECHFNSTQAILYHFVALPSIPELTQPMPLTALQIVSTGPWKASYRVSFDIIDGNQKSCFDVKRSSKSGWLQLVRPVIGPERFTLRLYLDVIDHYQKRSLRSRTVAYVDIDVASPIF